jgi:hypothetical protein
MQRVLRQIATRFAAKCNAKCGKTQNVLPHFASKGLSQHLSDLPIRQD